MNVLRLLRDYSSFVVEDPYNANEASSSLSDESSRFTSTTAADPSITQQQQDGFSGGPPPPPSTEYTSNDANPTQEGVLIFAMLCFSFFIGICMLRGLCASYMAQRREMLEEQVEEQRRREASVTRAQQKLSLTLAERRAYVQSCLQTKKFGSSEDDSRCSGGTGSTMSRSSSYDSCSSSENKSVESGDLEAGETVEKSPNHSCAICLDEFVEGDDVCSSQNELCSHQFHRQCLFEWLVKCPDCPCCRRNYLSSTEDESTITWKYTRSRPSNRDIEVGNVTQTVPTTPPLESILEPVAADNLHDADAGSV